MEAEVLFLGQAAVTSPALRQKLGGPLQSEQPSWRPSRALSQDFMFVLGIGCGMAGMCLLTRNRYLTCFMRTVVI